MKKSATLLLSLLLVACNFHNEIGDFEMMPPPSTISAPIITLAESDEQLTTTQECGIWLQPAIDGVYDSLIWTLDGRYIGSTPKIHITAEKGAHLISICAQRTQGEQSVSNSVTRTIRIVESHELPLHIHIPQSEYTLAKGEILRIAPIIFAPAPTIPFSWSINGAEVKSSNEAWLDFEATTSGEHTVTLAAGGNEWEYSIDVIDARGTPHLPATDSSSMTISRVLEYRPAPGQFINTGVGSRTPEEYALAKLEAQEIFSLGSFGGYIAVGFEHNINNHEGDDFRIRSNAFENSSEPGIIWVMQDLNGNGKADEVWYELRGSETDVATTSQNIAITYLHNTNRPLGNIQWRGSDGSCGIVERNSFHATNNYYPQWESSSYTLAGTIVQPRVEFTDGKFIALPYGWGYADNYSSEATDGWNYFDIDNAMTFNGTSAGLTHIDFIKVQSGVCYSTPVTGEISTEISAIEAIK